MKRIFEHAMKCTACKWKGTVGECGDIEHEDGQLDCPICHAIAIDDWERDNNAHEAEQNPPSHSEVN